MQSIKLGKVSLFPFVTPRDFGRWLLTLSFYLFGRLLPILSQSFENASKVR